MSGKRTLPIRWTQRLAWFVVLVELVLVVAAAYFNHISNPTASQPTSWISWWVGLVITTLPILASLIIGVLIVIRLPGNRYGWVLIGFSFAFGGWRNFFDSFGGYLYTSGGSLRGVGLAAYLAGIGWVTGAAFLAFILLLFPTGQYLSLRWRFLGRLTLLVTALDIGLALFVPGELGFIAQIENPFGLTGTLGSVVGFLVIASAIIVIVSIFSGVLSVIVRYFRSQGVERQQIKWFVFAAFILGLSLLLDNATELPQPWETIKESSFLALLPLAIGIAILRYHLWDIDVIIRRTLVYGALTATLALVFFGAVTLLQSLFVAVSGQRSAVATVISTLVIAALFNPLRKRIQHDIDRRFFRRKYDAEKVVEAFSASLREGVDLDDLQNQLLAVVEDTLQPESLSLWLKERSR